MLTDNISRGEDGSLFFAGQSVRALAAEYGTPLYLMDEERIRSNCRLYLDAFREAFGEAALGLRKSPVDIDYEARLHKAVLAASGIEPWQPK